MRVVNMHEAKTHLSRLVDEDFVIARDGKPVARVTPIREVEPVKRLGFLTDIQVPSDFDEMGGIEIRTMFGAG